MSSDKDLMINDKEDTESVDFGDLLGEGVEPLKGKGAHRVVAPLKSRRHRGKAQSSSTR